MAEANFYQDFIAKQAEKLGDKPYILQAEGNVSFAQYHEKCCQAANGLAKQGASQGEGMAVFMENRPEMPDLKLQK